VAWDFADFGLKWQKPLENRIKPQKTCGNPGFAVDKGVEKPQG
jgi:hypothetical protein